MDADEPPDTVAAFLLDATGTAEHDPAHAAVGDGSPLRERTAGSLGLCGPTGDPGSER